MNPVALAPIYLFIFPIKHKIKVLLLAKVSNSHFLSFEPFHSNKLNCQKEPIEQTKRTFFISFYQQTKNKTYETKHKHKEFPLTSLLTNCEIILHLDRRIIKLLIIIIFFFFFFKCFKIVQFYANHIQSTYQPLHFTKTMAKTQII